MGEGIETTNGTDSMTDNGQHYPPPGNSAVERNDASQYSVKDLKSFQGSPLFEQLDFSRCSDSQLEKLFFVPDKYLPPVGYRNTASQITEWTSLPTLHQEQLFSELGIAPTGKFKRPPRRAVTDPKKHHGGNDAMDANGGDESTAIKKKRKPAKKKDKDASVAEMEQPARKKQRKLQQGKTLPDEPQYQANALNVEELALQEKSHNLLRSDQYSAMGSILLDNDESDHEEAELLTQYRGHQVMLDAKNLLQISRNQLTSLIRGELSSATADFDANVNHFFDGSKAKRNKRSVESTTSASVGRSTRGSAAKGQADSSTNRYNMDSDHEEEDLHNSASIFGQTQGQNATWVECDRCKKWRRLRGATDAKKLPPKWYCNMNKNDPAHARCSAPEENYEGQPMTPDMIADAKARKHFRVWSRRIKTQEAYEARQPAMTRGKKRQVVSTCKDPYEWVRCCNPSCGKWRAILRVMGAKSHVIDRATDGEWYCVMNTWDEKMASCAAPQENLPTADLPSWVLQDNSQR